MIEIADITFTKYIELEDKHAYNYVSNYSPKLNTAKDLFNIGPFNELTFGQVKDAQTIFKNGIGWKELINFVSDMTGKKQEKIAGYKFFELCKVRRYVEEQLARIYRIESSLYYEVSTIDKAAGIDNLAKFGVMIQIDNLAGGDPLKYDPVRALPYEVGFMKLLMDKERAEYDVAKNRLTKPK
jgi:hypothetical protein